jgi:hypothetical protein
MAIEVDAVARSNNSNTHTQRPTAAAADDDKE